MKKKEDLRKQEELFKVPENYFDKFQARMSDLTAADDIKESSFAVGKSRVSLRLAYVLPALLVVLVAVYAIWFTGNSDSDLLSNVSTADLVEFLEEDGVTEEELISFLDDAEHSLEIDLYQDEELLDDLGDSELEDLSDEMEIFNEYL